MIQIAFIDDFARIRNDVAIILQSPPFGYKVYQYDNGEDFVNRFQKENYTPSIVLMDIRMSPMDGFETTSWLTENHPTIPVLAFSDVIHIEAIIKISRCGAKGCTEKDFTPIERFDGILKRIINGGTYYDSVFIEKMVKKYLLMDKNDIHEGFSSLTDREIDVMKLASAELTAEEKAKQLGISKPTFNKHISNIYQKMNINKSSALTNLAKRLGLIE